MPILRVKTGPNTGNIYQLADESLGLGRGEEEQVQIFDQGVSRKHATIFRIGEMFFIEDLKSRNGTFVNDEKIEKELLRTGDRIRIGSTEMVFEDYSDASSEPPRDIRFSSGDDHATTIEYRLADSADAQDLPAEAEGVVHAQESQDLKVLYQVANVISTEREARPMFDKIVRAAAEAVGADQGYIFTAGKGKSELAITASWEREGKDAPLVSRSIIKRVLKHSRAVLTSDASLDDRFSAEQSIVMKQIKSVICAPLVAMERTMGVIYLSTAKVSEAFKTDDLELVTAVGIQAGIALQSIEAARRQQEGLVGALSAVVAAIEMRDPRSKGHGARVATYASAAAGALKLSPEANRAVQIAALLHDIGKLGLTDEERLGPDPTVKTMQARHAEKLGKELTGMEGAVDGIVHHAERWDGSGYPDGLKGEAIPQGSRIIATAMELDAILTGGGPDGADLSLKDGLLRLKDRAGKSLDPEVVQAVFIAHRNGTLFDPPHKLAGL